VLEFLMQYQESYILLGLLGAVLLAWRSTSISFIVSLLTLGLALSLGRVNVIAILLLLGFGGIAFLFYQRSIPSFLKAILAILLIILTGLFYLHKAPGFNNWVMISDLKLSADSLPYKLYLNLDKIFAGLFLLLAAGRFAQKSKEWLKSFIVTLEVTLPLAVILMGLALAFQYVRFDFKIPTLLILWAPVNLLFVCMAEEAFFRGFLQEQLRKILGDSIFNMCLAIGIPAFLFGLCHFPGGPLYMIFATIAGAGYGYAYERSGGRIEAAMLTHFMINLIHFIGFSYPALEMAR
jgi:membrane protease YdiL (CAAX protease family)